MAITEEGIYVCDYCGEDVGRFDEETGNHNSCAKLFALRARLAELEAVAESMAFRLETNKYVQNKQNDDGIQTIPFYFNQDDEDALEAYEAYKSKHTAADEQSSGLS